MYFVLDKKDIGAPKRQITFLCYHTINFLLFIFCWFFIALSIFRNLPIIAIAFLALRYESDRFYFTFCYFLSEQYRATAIALGIVKRVITKERAVEIKQRD